MSHCGRTHALEAMVAGELPDLAARDLRGHAGHCALCRHELSWLETEHQLARRRAGRDEVEHLWRETTPARQGPRAAITRALLGMTAGLLVLLSVGQVLVWSHPGGAAGGLAEDEWSLQSFEAMTRFDPPSGDEACSRLPPGMGFHCGSVPASFIASR